MAGTYGISSSGAHVKVTTEILKSKAAETESAIKNVKQSFDEINRLLERTSGYWEGEAGDLYRRTYQKQNEIIQKILSDVQEYPGKLLQIAGVYETSETKNIGTVSELKVDLL